MKFETVKEIDEELGAEVRFTVRVLEERVQVRVEMPEVGVQVGVLLKESSEGRVRRMRSPMMWVVAKLTLMV